MCSFLACPNVLSFIGGIIFIVFLVSIFSYIRSKKLFRSALLFSVGVNIILLIDALGNSLWFRIYNVEWLQYFAVFLWPLINIIFIIWYVRSKKQ